MSKKNRQARDMELDVAEEAMDEASEVEIKVEEAKVEVKPKVESPKVEFDGWYALRSAAIPAIHKKEIIKADFKGRKVPMMGTIAEFDEALRMYGIKLA